jgi:hypothetical protein
MSDWVETPTSLVRIRDDDILEIRVKDGAVGTLEIAKHGLDIAAELIGESGPKPMLLVLGGLVKMTSEARTYYSECKNTNSTVSRVAIVMKSYISRIIGNLFIGLNRTVTPVSLFTDEGKAVAWLKRPS